MNNADYADSDESIVQRNRAHVRLIGIISIENIRRTNDTPILHQVSKTASIRRQVLFAVRRSINGRKYSGGAR
jgi:hypothetical protein